MSAPRPAVTRRVPGRDEQRPRRPRQEEHVAKRPRTNTGIGPARAAQAAMRQIAGLTGKKPEGVTAVGPADDGWAVCVEVVEDRRIPSSADVLAVYEAQISADGELLSYRRASRYSRGRGDSGGNS